MSKIYIALGSNLDEPSEQIYKAINSIDAVDDLSVTHISSLYKTKPIGKIDQPDFINAAIFPGNEFFSSCIFPADSLTIIPFLFLSILILLLLC